MKKQDGVELIEALVHQSRVTLKLKKGVRKACLWRARFLPHNLLYKCRVRGGRCGGAVAGGLTGRHPLTGGRGALHPNTPKNNL